MSTCLPTFNRPSLLIFPSIRSYVKLSYCFISPSSRMKGRRILPRLTSFVSGKEKVAYVELGHGKEVIGTTYVQKCSLLLL